MIRPKAFFHELFKFTLESFRAPFVAGDAFVNDTYRQLPCPWVFVTYAWAFFHDGHITTFLYAERACVKNLK